MLAGARAEGEAKGRADVICKFLDARFGEASQGLQKKIRRIHELAILDKIMNNIYTADLLEDAETIIDGTTK